MIYVYATILTLLNAAWLLLTIIGVPGTWLMVLSALVATWLTWQAGVSVHAQMIGPTALLVAAALALLGEVLEFAAGLAGTQQAGGTWWGAIGALIGTLIGGIAGTFAVPVPLFGSLIGACLGAAGGALAMELYSGQKFDFALKSGVGAGVGRLFGTLGKLACGVAIWIVLSIAAFWP